jgi:hypothetical protein
LLRGLLFVTFFKACHRGVKKLDGDENFPSVLYIQILTYRNLTFDYLTLIGMAKDENDRAAFKG